MSQQSHVLSLRGMTIKIMGKDLVQRIAYGSDDVRFLGWSLDA
jgi:hypothetical protein